MSSQKKLQQAVIKFRKENPTEYSLYSSLLSAKAKAITKSETARTNIRIKNEKRYDTTDV